MSADELLAREVPDEYAYCRAWGHDWKFTTLDRSGRDYVQGKRCHNCRTECLVHIDSRTGRRDPSRKRYIYPEKIYDNVNPYQMPKGSGGALTADERGVVTLQEIKSRYDEVAARRRKTKKRA